MFVFVLIAGQVRIAASGNAAETADNIRASGTLFRVGREYGPFLLYGRGYRRQATELCGVGLCDDGRLAYLKATNRIDKFPATVPIGM